MKSCFNCEYFTGDNVKDWLNSKCGKTEYSVEIELSSPNVDHCSSARKFWKPKAVKFISEDKEYKLNLIMSKLDQHSETLKTLIKNQDELLKIFKPKRM
jgi:hypothetical protein